MVCSTLVGSGMEQCGGVTAQPILPSEAGVSPSPLAAKDGRSRKTMHRRSSPSRPATTISKQPQRRQNLYTSFPSVGGSNISCNSSSSSSSEGQNGTVSRNGVRTGSRSCVDTPIPSPQPRLCILPPAPPSPVSDGVQGGTVPDSSRSFSLQLAAPSPRRRNGGAANVSVSPALHSPLSQRRQSCGSADEDSGTAVMPAPWRGEWTSPPPCGSSRESQDYLYLYKHLPRVDSDTDLQRLGRSMHGLCEGCFYYPSLDSDGARTLLQSAPEGTFLVRDSSDPKFLFSLTVKTARGATSVRIQYHRGFFQLDCEDQMKRKLPRFETMLDLLDFHVAMCQEKQGAQYRWLESSKRKDMVVRLNTPRRHSPPSLTHLARVAVNRSLEDLHLPSRSTDLLPLPSSMKSYLRAYPYKV